MCNLPRLGNDFRGVVKRNGHFWTGYKWECWKIASIIFILYDFKRFESIKSIPFLILVLHSISRLFKSKIQFSSKCIDLNRFREYWIELWPYKRRTHIIILDMYLSLTNWYSSWSFTTTIRVWWCIAYFKTLPLSSEILDDFALSWLPSCTIDKRFAWYWLRLRGKEADTQLDQSAVKWSRTTRKHAINRNTPNNCCSCYMMFRLIGLSNGTRQCTWIFNRCPTPNTLGWWTGDSYTFGGMHASKTIKTLLLGNIWFRTKDKGAWKGRLWLGWQQIGSYWMRFRSWKE